MSEPRALTTDEMRQAFLEQCRTLTEYWARPSVAPEYDTRQRLSGLLHSILCVIDGASAGFNCALDLVCRPHPDDKAYQQQQGDNWIEDGTVLNGSAMLHELLPYPNGR